MASHSPIDVAVAKPHAISGKVGGRQAPLAEAATETSGSSAGKASTIGELDAYAAQVRERIGQSLQYPVGLQRRRISGRIRLKLTLDAQGRVQTQEITEHAAGTGTAALDELALAAVREAQPFPEPPAGLKRSGTIVLNLPVDFKL
jgi:protein TonB